MKLLSSSFIWFRLVAPPVGAWIETMTITDKSDYTRVAPPVGAWIETYYWVFLK